MVDKIGLAQKCAGAEPNGEQAVEISDSGKKIDIQICGQQFMDENFNSLVGKEVPWSAVREDLQGCGLDIENIKGTTIISCQKTGVVCTLIPVLVPKENKVQRWDFIPGSSQQLQSPARGPQERASIMDALKAHVISCLICHGNFISFEPPLQEHVIQPKIRKCGC